MMAPNMSRIGKVNGEGNAYEKTTAMMVKIKLSLFFFAILLILKQAIITKPKAIGPMNRKMAESTCGRNTANNDISMVAGNIQIIRVRKASLGPPILNAIAVSVCVELGPGII